MTTLDVRHATASDVVQTLDTQTDLAVLELQAALANALERIASLEHDRDELEQIFKTFNEMKNAAKLHGPGIFNTQ